MKILIDTNVLISALLRDRNPERAILYIIGKPELEWVVSSEILAEYKDVISRKKFGLPAELIQRWYQLLEDVTTPYDVKSSIQFPRDQKDAKFLACALHTEADFLITGDKDYSEAQKLVTTIILSVSQFVKLVVESDK